MIDHGKTHYSSAQKFLHWAIAILITWQFVSHFMIDSLPEGSTEQFRFKASHGLSGFAILLLTSIRLIVRWRKGVPSLPTSMPAWQRTAASMTHPALYFLIFGQTISGIMAGVAGIKAAGPVHGTLSLALLVLALVHIGAAVMHMFKGDGLGTRMFRQPREQ